MITFWSRKTFKGANALKKIRSCAGAIEEVKVFAGSRIWNSPRPD